MRGLRAKFVSLRALLATAWPILLVSAVALYVAYQFVEPAPPKRIVITTGGDSGAYYQFAQRYATILARDGAAAKSILPLCKAGSMCLSGPW